MRYRQPAERGGQLAAAARPSPRRRHRGRLCGTRRREIGRRRAEQAVRLAADHHRNQRLQNVRRCGPRTLRLASSACRATDPATGPSGAPITRACCSSDSSLGQRQHDGPLVGEVAVEQPDADAGRLGHVAASSSGRSRAWRSEVDGRAEQLAPGPQALQGGTGRPAAPSRAVRDRAMPGCPVDCSREDGPPEELVHGYQQPMSPAALGLSSIARPPSSPARPSGVAMVGVGRRHLCEHYGAVLFLAAPLAMGADRQRHRQPRRAPPDPARARRRSRSPCWPGRRSRPRRLRHGRVWSAWSWRCPWRCPFAPRLGGAVGRSRGGQGSVASLLRRVWPLLPAAAGVEATQPRGGCLARGAVDDRD